MKLALLNMPFASAARPSLALGLLKALATREGWKADVYNFNLALANRIGPEMYEFLSGSLELENYVVPTDHLLGEWLFSQCYNGIGSLDAESYIRRLILEPGWRMPPSLCTRVLDIRHILPTFLDECLSAADWSQYDLIGFTTSFEQTNACLCLARRIREISPQVLIAIGGANCEESMGEALFRNYPFLDIVSTGEADDSFPQLLRELARGDVPTPLPGLLLRLAGKTLDGGRPPLVRDLDSLPFPNYDEYFRERDSTGFARRWTRGAFVETSRGCWWGAKSHCTFCGLNGQTMTFRSKSPSRAKQEVEAIAIQYLLDWIDFTDNILDLNYLEAVIPVLAAHELGFEMFYETKSNLKRSQVRQLAQNRVTQIQPGIESFSDSILQSMGKGVGGLQNLALLRWARLYGIDAAWNLLYGFPCEDPAEYRWMNEIIPSIVHLTPPQAVGKIRLDRFSPNFTRSEDLGLTNVRPIRAYEHTFDLAPPEIARLAYYFDYDHADGREPSTYVRPIVRACECWSRRHRSTPASLFATVDLREGLMVWDTRNAGVAPMYHVVGRQLAATYCFLDKPQSEATARNFAMEHGAISDQSFSEAVADWQYRGLVIARNGKIIATALIGDEVMRHFGIELDSQLRAA